MFYLFTKHSEKTVLRLGSDVFLVLKIKSLNTTTLRIRVEHLKVINFTYESSHKRRAFS